MTIDGVPNEAAWQAIPPLPLTMYTPVFRGKPTQRPEIRVAYDDEYLYAAGWFYDADASSIRVNSLYRDRWNGDDAFAIYIDAFNDPYSTVGFMATTYAGGSRRNDGLGADGVFRFSGDQYLTMKVASTTDNTDTTGATLADQSLVDFKIDRRVERGLQYNVSLSRAGRDYRPELGFLPRTDFTIANVGGNYFFFTDRQSLLSPRLSRRARLSHFQKLGSCARIRAMGSLGRVGHERRRRWMG